MTDLWTGEFGNAYTERNRARPQDCRGEIWASLLPPRCQSVLEVGANVGHNLEAIAQFSAADLYACEPNEMAHEELRQTGLAPIGHFTRDCADRLSFPDGLAEAVITCGVLIHIPPDKLLASMREIHRCSARSIICGEYFAPSEEMIRYRGHDNALWRRDYGSLWLDNFTDLYPVMNIFAWKRMTGMDNLVFWRFDKGPRKN